jgi:acetyl esterase/lipase
MQINRMMIAVSIGIMTSLATVADEPIRVWPGLAPGETTEWTGETLPFRETDVPRITRISGITAPTLHVMRPEKSNGTAVVILPGGGFARVVPDLEGSEAATWLGRFGVTSFVLNYRTNEGTDKPGWVEPLQDAQRAISLIRSQANTYGLKTDRIGMVAFSAGGQVGARLMCAGSKPTYDKVDSIDEVSHRPDFSILVYPWNMYDANKDRLAEGIEVDATCPPTYIVHTHDDKSSSLGAVLFYVGLKKHNIASELHVYGNGGHGYGLRKIAGSQISSWPDHAAHWLKTIGVIPEN